MSAVSTETTDLLPPPAGSKTAWFVAGAIVELLAWGVLLALLVLLVPRQQQMLADFGVPVPRSVQGIFAASDLIATHWYIALPTLAVLVLGSVYLVAVFCRTAVMRLALLVILAVVPLGWALWCHLAMMSVTSQLIQDLS